MFLEHPAPSPRRLAVEFRWLGWLGFWLQSLLGFIPILLLVFALFFYQSPHRGTVDIGDFLAFACLVALLFTIYWCFRYTRVEIDLENPNFRPRRMDVMRMLWVGLLSNSAGMLCAVLIGMGKASTLLTTMLSLPPGAVTLTTPIQGGTLLNRGPVITVLDMVAMQAVVNTIIDLDIDWESWGELSIDSSQRSASNSAVVQSPVRDRQLWLLVNHRLLDQVRQQIIRTRSNRVG
ncbi:DUF3611 family protein [Trichothermofontia sp.]